MKDDKRLIRELKRQVKKSGNRKRRRHLKDIDADPAEFDFGRDRSDTLNDRKSSRAASRPRVSEDLRADSATV